MPAQQTEQIVQAALQAPINNLIVFGILIALIIVLGSGFLIWRFMPIILKQIQQLIDNNTQLTKIAERNATEAEKAQKSADENARELVKQTDYLSKTVTLLSDFKNFQKLNNDQTADVGKKLETLTETVKPIPESVADLKADIAIKFASISEKLDELLKDRADCGSFKAEWDTFRHEFLDRLQTPASAVSNVTVNTSAAEPANVIPDDGADTKPASEAA